MTHQLIPAQITTLKSALRYRFDALREEVRQDLLKSDDDRSAMLADRVRDVGDESLADLIVDLDLADTDRDLEELRDVEAALGRINLGTYGMCVHCGGPIPVERLTAFPTAKRCQPCQRMHEKTYAQRTQATL
ncbi:MAG: dksA [Proteobacteria bacterium]|nr:dksA [Pseudomonadota bacterium]